MRHRDSDPRSLAIALAGALDASDHELEALLESAELLAEVERVAPGPLPLAHCAAPLGAALAGVQCAGGGVGESRPSSANSASTTSRSLPPPAPFVANVSALPS